MSQVIKRNGKKVDFDRDKIVIAIEKAMHSSSGLYIEN
ncbi:ATP cone domain-containing protein, partial [Peptoniphilus rhinitidis]